MPRRILRLYSGGKWFPDNAMHFERQRTRTDGSHLETNRRSVPFQASDQRLFALATADR